MLGERELKALLNKHDFRPNKLLGQNFLVDKNMQKKILKHCDLRRDDIALEIGAGLGALTFDIAGGVKAIFAVEKDVRLSKILKKLAKGCNNLEIISSDMLKVNIKEICKNKKLKVIGNLPYYISSPLITYLIENRQFLEYIFVTLQKEVGKRLIASPGSKDYSAISVYTQFYTELRQLFLITRRVFYPQPDVDSVFMRLDILRHPRVEVRSEEFFFRVVRTAFAKRRKTILNALASGDILGLEKKDIENLLKRANINPMKRPEELSLQHFADIANSI